MTVYAASSIASITVSPAHKGCGQLHSRPVRDGVPARVWALDCDPCSQFLRTDPMWATSLRELPETYDERLAREDFEKRGASDRDSLVMLALTKMANVELPETLRRPLAAVPSRAAVTGALMECSSGHGSEPGSRFCGECGEPLNVSLRRTCPDGHEVAARFCGECGQPAAPAVVPALGAAAA